MWKDVCGVHHLPSDHRSRPFLVDELWCSCLEHLWDSYGKGEPSISSQNINCVCFFVWEPTEQVSSSGITQFSAVENELKHANWLWAGIRCSISLSVNECFMGARADVEWKATSNLEPNNKQNGRVIKNEHRLTKRMVPVLPRFNQRYGKCKVHYTYTLEREAKRLFLETKRLF